MRNGRGERGEREGVFERERESGGGGGGGGCNAEAEPEVEAFFSFFYAGRLLLIIIMQKLMGLVV